LSLLERIQKIREAANQTTPREDWQATIPVKRNRWQTFLLMLQNLLWATPMLLFFAKDIVPYKNVSLIRVLDGALFLSCALAMIGVSAFAWRDWDQARNQKKSKSTRVRLALTEVSMGLFVLMILFFSNKVSFRSATYLLLVPVGMIALTFVPMMFEPSRKNKLASVAVIGWSAITVLLFLGGYRLLSALDVTSNWLQVLILFPVAFVISRLFHIGKTSRERRQKVG